MSEFGFAVPADVEIRFDASCRGDAGLANVPRALA
jgi:hypothetical protein